MNEDFRRFCLLLEKAVEENDHPRPAGTSMLDPTSVIGLFGYDPPDPFLLYIQKADNAGYAWSNQMAFPGGHAENGDQNLLETALRELNEELSISREHVCVLGSIGHFHTLNNKDIKAFLGVWDQVGEIWFDSAEIARVFRIPLGHLMETHLSQRFHGRMPDFQELIYPYGPVRIWGATAKITHHLMDMILDAVRQTGCAFPFLPEH